MKRRTLIILLLAVIGLSGWLFINPPGRFGFCTFGCLTFGSVPRPVSDLQVRADGKCRSGEKTHRLSFDELEWLLDPKPEVLIIGIGWDGVVVPSEDIESRAGCEVRLLKTGEAVELYNKLKREGRRVAIHVHSTC